MDDKTRMQTGTRSAVAAQADNDLARAFEMRHPALALGWRAVRRSPIRGGFIMLVFLLVSALALEAGGIVNRRVSTWIDVNWAPQWAAHDRKVALAKADATGQSMRIHIGQSQRLTRPVPYYAVEGGYGEMHSSMLPTMEVVEDYYDAGVLKRGPSVLHTGSVIRSVYVADNEVAQTNGYVMIWYGPTYGFIPLAAYQAAGLPMNAAQTSLRAVAGRRRSPVQMEGASRQSAIGNFGENIGKVSGYVAAAPFALLALLLWISFVLARLPHRARTSALSQKFVQASDADRKKLNVGGRWWTFTENDWQKVSWSGGHLVLISPASFDQRVQDEMQYARARESSIHFLIAVSVIAAGLCAAWGWGLDQLVANVSGDLLNENILTEISLSSILFVLVVLLFTAGFAVDVWEWLYQNGSQRVAGAMVLDPEPSRVTREDIEQQDPYGKARNATEMELRDAAAPIGKSRLEDQEF